MQLEPGSADRYSFHPSFSAMVPVEAPGGVIGLSSNRDGNSITLFDKLTGRVTRAIRTGRQPTGVALGPVGRRAYVAVYDENAIQTIDLQAFGVIDRLQLNGGDHPLELALTPDGRTLLSVNHGSDSVSFIDAAVLVETDRIAVGRRPVSVLLDHAGSRAFVFDSLSDTITILDVARRERIATIATDARPVRGQLDRSGERLYVIHRSSPNMLVFDTTTFSLLRRVNVGTGATAIRVDPQTDRVHIARHGAREISIFDPFSLLPVDSIEVDGDVTYIGLDDENRNLLLVLVDRQRIRIVQITGSRTVAEVDVGENPFWAATVGER
jgi:YVTN family beta-propeller protein